MLRVPQFHEIVSAFGVAPQTKLAGPGDREAAIRSPIERLITDFAAGLGLTAVPYDEVRDADRAVRPDYAIAVNGAITGYIEVKRPGAAVDPDLFTGHNKSDQRPSRPTKIDGGSRLRDAAPKIFSPRSTTCCAHRPARPRFSCWEDGGGSLARRMAAQLQHHMRLMS